MAEGLADFRSEYRGKGGRGDYVEAPSIGCMESVPKPNETILAVGVEHGRGEALPAILIPDVVKRTHRILATRVMDFELLQRGVSIGAHSSV